MDRKLIFLDVDGTLTPPGGYVPPESAFKPFRRYTFLISYRPEPPTAPKTFFSPARFSDCFCALFVVEY